MSEDFAIQVQGLDELVRGARLLQREAADELNEILEDAAEPALQDSYRRAPGRGRMARRTRLAKGRGGGIVLRNTHPGANATHWGRKFWPNQRHPRRTPSEVSPSPWLYTALVENRDELAFRVAERFEAWATKHLT